MNSPFPAQNAGGRYDVVVIGGGIVGLATAVTVLQRHPECRLAVLEAEADVGQHQSGNNSGVIHSGLYYRPGSTKAKTCREGKQLLEQFCRDESVRWDRCGKVVVAVNADERQRLDQIADRATQNGVEFELIDTDRLRQLEPAAAGLAALHVPETGIVDYPEVCRAMVRRIRAAGGQVITGFRVEAIDVAGDDVVLKAVGHDDPVRCDRYVNCGGLQCDRIARAAGVKTDVRIVPFRGEYFELKSESQRLCRNLIYPVPDPSFPFLGVHFTRMIQGGVECGPNAVLAMARHGYRWSDVSVSDLAETLSFAGFRKLAGKHWRMGAGEMYRSFSKHAFTRALQKLIPSIRPTDLKPGRSGVRAQAVTPEGDLVDDFLIQRGPRSVHVLNAPSPAATASLAIARHVVDRFESEED
ncbi:L-2-hydroxyglutarate oxidase [Crateriforma conspicua]|uniref:L-2-hydroxyglutarate oxidase n=1 Tax=Crateriforma conspicua TaxID=2527996 RepID=UPI0011886081|nr:L-2-hydroxyglutarate oxidase [Crateriforma conspicua]QDV65333.1 L-2-hydroxyglutarate oxidase LhgO [Crateriforma conspicua]